MTPMTEEWVSLWYQCLTQNIDYSRYCHIRDAGDRWVDVEARFDKISDIYDDFGTLEQWPDAGMQSAVWREWFEPRRHLFMTAPRVVLAPTSYVAQAGHLLIEVPLQRDARATSAAVVDLIAQQYAAGGVSPAPTPKYVLREVSGRLAHGIQQVRQACRSVVRSYRYDLETMEELRHVDAVAAFVRHELDNMGWSLDSKARDELGRSGKLSEQRLESFKTMLNRCRKDFRAFAANTIRASFPDDRPFASSVLDIH